jgi:hypothetical protein
MSANNILCVDEGVTLFTTIYGGGYIFKEAGYSNDYRTGRFLNVPMFRAWDCTIPNTDYSLKGHFVGLGFNVKIADSKYTNSDIYNTEVLLFQIPGSPAEKLNGANLPTATEIADAEKEITLYVKELWSTENSSSSYIKNGSYITSAYNLASSNTTAVGSDWFLESKFWRGLLDSYEKENNAGNKAFIQRQINYFAAEYQNIQAEEIKYTAISNQAAQTVARKSGIYARIFERTHNEYLVYRDALTAAMDAAKTRADTLGNASLEQATAQAAEQKKYALYTIKISKLDALESTKFSDLETYVEDSTLADALDDLFFNGEKPEPPGEIEEEEKDLNASFIQTVSELATKDSIDKMSEQDFLDFLYNIAAFLDTNAKSTNPISGADRTSIKTYYDNAIGYRVAKYKPSDTMDISSGLGNIGEINVKKSNNLTAKNSKDEKISVYNKDYNNALDIVKADVIKYIGTVLFGITGITSNDEATFVLSLYKVKDVVAEARLPLEDRNALADVATTAITKRISRYTPEVGSSKSALETALSKVNAAIDADYTVNKIKDNEYGVALNELVKKIKSMINA